MAAATRPFLPESARKPNESAKKRMSCEYINPRPDTVRWGIGDREMCVFLGFSDSTYNWAGGIHSRAEPENPQMVGNVMTCSNGCTLLVIDASQ